MLVGVSRRPICANAEETDQYAFLDALKLVRTFTRLTTKDRENRPFLLNSLRACWREPFELLPEKRLFEPTPSNREPVEGGLIEPYHTNQ
jgi:hypothetical protein